MRNNYARLIFCLLFSNCFHFFANSNELNIKIKSNNSLIGFGFNSISGEIKNSCLSNTSYHFQESKKSYIKYFHNISVSDLNEILGFDIKNSSSYELINFSSESGFKEIINISDKSINTALISKYIYGNNFLKSDNIEDKFYLNIDSNKLLKKSVYDFYNDCGNAIIESQELSSIILINAAIIFENKEEKIKFEENFKVNFNIFDIKNNNDFIEKLKDYNFKINITGAQYGGNTKKINKILKINSCNIKEIKKCFDIFENIFEYVSQEYLNQIEEQNIENFITTNIKFTPYTSLLIYDSENIIKNEELKIQNDIFNILEKSESSKNRSIDLINRANFLIKNEKFNLLSMNDKNYIISIRDASNRNINYINNIIESCKKDNKFYDCIEKYKQNILKNIENSYDYLSFKIENYNIFTDAFIYQIEPILGNINGTELYISHIDFSNILNIKAKYVFLDENGYEVDSSDFIRLHCLKNFAKRYSLDVWDVLFPIKGLVKTIDKAVNNKEYALLDVIYNKKSSLINDANSQCGENTEFILSLNSGTKIKKIVIWKEKIYEY